MGNILEFSFMYQTFFELLSYIPITLGLAVVSMVLASILGVITAIIQFKRIAILKPLSDVYILLGRAIPTMVMIYLVYFGLPILLLVVNEKIGIETGFNKVPAMAFAIIALTLHTGAYLAEIFRAALQSVDKGQMEAALSIGMTWFEGFYRIVLRQASVFAMPLVANQFLDLIKSTSIVFVITVVELLGAAKIACADTYRYLETYLVVALLYWIISIVFEKLFLLAETKLASFKRGTTS